ETTFSFFFAGTVLLALLGPNLYLRLYTRITPQRLYGSCLIIILVSGVLVATVGWMSPWAFFLSFLWVPFANSIARPAITALLLEQHEGDAGTLSALINFGLYLLGLLGMVAASVAQGNYVLSLGVVIIVFALLSLSIFLVLLRSKIPVKGLDTLPE
ncbi:MAG: hypothetical protein LBJ48_06920, partial [Coriobacteriales bacterium]|nr:hypothetical protein [Coriobacteriales bacterium]